MSVHSIDRATWETKLKRVGEIATSQKDQVFNNLGHLIDLEMLKAMYCRLDSKKAIGIDGITKEVYGEQLETNLKDLLSRIRKGNYHPKPSRIVEIPKEDGSTRPLAIACVEDKIVQMAANSILSEIFEPIFSENSFGFRPGKNCHQALKTLARQTYQNHDGAIVEIDIRKCFNSIPHLELGEFLRKKISDTRFLHLIERLTHAPTQHGDKVVVNDLGCPQGSILSPVLSNLFLHFVIDVWFEEIRKTHLRGRSGLVRYCDDMVFTFQYLDDAKRFFKALPLRLQKYGLQMHMDKSQMIPAGTFAAARSHSVGKRLPTFKFLGFTCYWGKAWKKDFWRLKFSSRSDRFTAKLNGLRKYLWNNLNIKDTDLLLKQITAIVKGWVNYHAISDNDKRVGGFILKCKRLIFRWFKRRGGRRSISWTQLARVLVQIGFPTKWKVTSMF